MREMDAYMFQADLYCEDCILEVCIANKALSPAARDIGWLESREQWMEANAVETESDYDSDEFPKGPFSDGGGESDSPAHCGACGVFLENDLTADGVEYLHSAIVDYLTTGHGDCVREWIDFYDVGLSDLLDRARDMSSEGEGGAS